MESPKKQLQREKEWRGEKREKEREESQDWALRYKSQDCTEKAELPKVAWEVSRNSVDNQENVVS